jgi:NADPH-dependent curcumin reductase CurA
MFAGLRNLSPAPSFWHDAPRGFADRPMLRGATVAGRSPDRWEASVATLADWVRAGRLRYEEEILEGLESSPDALAGLYRGENKGKRLIRVRT